MPAADKIFLRGVSVHNLKAVDLDLPHRKLIVFCGLSGSGKSSLALDTLYAEGQRRYIESFSAYTRQFLQRLEKPEAERIDGIPPAIAVTGKNANRSSRSTVGTATETNDYLRLLFAKIGQVYCRGCGRVVRRDTPQSVAEELARLPAGTRFMVAFRREWPAEKSAEEVTTALREEGFVRAIAGGGIVNLAESPLPDVAGDASPFYVVIDRLAVGSASDTRLRDSLETALAKGAGRCYLFVEGENASSTNDQRPTTNDSLPGWRRIGFSEHLACEDCALEYPPLEPRLFSFNSPLGACPECEGFGNVIGIDMELVVPDRRKSLREGAIAPWNTPAYEHELQELLALAADYDLPVDRPFGELDERQVAIIMHGVPERKFGGLEGFFNYLERRKYKMHVRVFLSRWRSYRPCGACAGMRLRPEALAVRVGGKNIGEISAMKIREAADFFRSLTADARCRESEAPAEPDKSPGNAGVAAARQEPRPPGQPHPLARIEDRSGLTDWQRHVGRMMLEQVQNRLGYLEEVGLHYLTLDRPLRTLSGGESRRVALTSALGSSLVNMLYVLDEPSIGLHPRDINQLLAAVEQLRDRGNTVVIVEHEEAMIRAADRIVEIGPGAGERGGKIVFQGTPREMEDCPESLTGDYFAGRRGLGGNGKRRTPNHGWVRLAGARGNNLKNVTVEFPLGMLCLVTGVSGSGKSTLVEDTLYPALCRRLRKDAPKPLAFDDVFGDGSIDDVIMIDQSPIGRSPRSNPVTYLKVFDEIRNVFADTVDARTRNYDAGHFSFNVDGGRCSACEGDGYIQIDMQFLADVYMKCSQCNGTRYRDEILDITYRGRNIAEVLEMTVREAFTFFRGQTKVQARLKRLIDVGLDYVRLGQPANTLSGGEAQRLKLAGYMSAAKRGRCLFILDEPTTGLHFFDIVQLLDCFEALLAVGHSLIVVEHNLQMMKAADYIVDLGPGAADEGGQVVAKGTPEMVARCAESVTGRYLAEVLKRDAAEGG
jgi:excinuclease ABC subunit A